MLLLCVVGETECSGLVSICFVPLQFSSLCKHCFFFTHFFRPLPSLSDIHFIVIVFERCCLLLFFLRIRFVIAPFLIAFTFRLFVKPYAWSLSIQFQWVCTSVWVLFYHKMYFFFSLSVFCFVCWFVRREKKRRIIIKEDKLHV